MATEERQVRTTTAPDGVRTIEIANPTRGNALTPAMRDDLARAFEDVRRDTEVRAVVLAAAGDRHFCTGADLSATPPRSDHRSGDVARTLRDGWQRLVAAIIDCDTPVVAAVTGTAAGAGMSLVLACDLVVMSSTATLVAPFVRRGILPDAGAIHLLTRAVGQRRAAEILMLAEPLDAEGCGRLAIATRVTEPADTRTEADAMAQRLASGPGVALAQIKRLLAVAPESDRSRAFDQEAWAQETVAATDDLAEGIAAFREKREPRFRGR
ncbi:enoyl-CoA hydratase-related protein [uncultured Williamsia sp.]|uniref:enoyl-CoA hydratase/isomerase family protein n=1 Tax=uncultured Williamsia sp. TaxID=259311 RepID=UPI002612A688|nr:enoyl-CoA hydratase-related protein [uncultured Williamsia sp.]